MNNVLNDLLAKYRVDRDFQREVRDGYRNPIQDVLGTLYDVGVQFIYGGSLAKGTANTNSCDIDLLCYVYSKSKMTLKEIYESTANALLDAGYCINKKNSAIEVTGKPGADVWDYTVDVVPGRYISETSKDVNLWNNRQKKSMKTNPETQINIVKESGCKDIIRIIKLYREFSDFKFKSFFLEIFAIDIVEDDFKDVDDITDKLLHFCNRFEDIGVKKIYDPANPNNNIMDIHNDVEFCVIREKIKILRDAILTDDAKTIRKCIFGESFDESDAYKNNAVNHSSLINFSNILMPYLSIRISGYYSKDGSYTNNLSENTILDIGNKLKFVAYVPSGIVAQQVSWIICNAGYEARKANSLRGNKKEATNGIQDVFAGKNYIRYEETSYYGNHYVQAVLITNTGKKHTSNIITVKIRK